MLDHLRLTASLAEEFGFASSKEVKNARKVIRNSLKRHLSFLTQQDLYDVPTTLWLILPGPFRRAAEEAWGHIQGESDTRAYEVETEFFWKDLGMDFEMGHIPDDFWLYSLRTILALKDAGWDSETAGFSATTIGRPELHIKTLAGWTLDFLNLPHTVCAENRIVKLLYMGAGRAFEINEAVGALGQPTFRRVCKEVRALVNRDGWSKNWELAYAYKNVWGNDGGDPKEPDKSWCQVYLMELFVNRRATQQYKIGVSKDPQARRRQIETGATKLPIEVCLLSAFPCEDAYAAERILHRTFSIERTKGEWFRLDARVVDRIKRIKSFDVTSAFTFCGGERRPEYDLIQYNMEVSQ